MAQMNLFTKQKQIHELSDMWRFGILIFLDILIIAINKP